MTLDDLIAHLRDRERGVLDHWRDGGKATLTVHWQTIRDECWRYPAVFALVIGVGNWGVEWTGFEGEIPVDPVSEGWRGPASTRTGKRWLDGPGEPAGYGGLGICHADSGLLQDVYRVFGSPWLLPVDLALTFDRLRKRPLAWQVWREWANLLLARPEFHAWLAAEWRRRYWDSAVAVWGMGDVDAIDACSVNARVGNSASGWAKHLRDVKANVSNQVAYYVRAKLTDRGPKAADRAARQAQYALRLGAVVRATRAGIPAI